MNPLSVLAIFAVLLIAAASAQSPDSTAAIASAPAKRAAQRSAKGRTQRRRKGAKRHPEDEDAADDEETGEPETGDESKDCPRLSVAKERCTAFGREVCAAHPNVFQTAPKIYHACLRDYCRGFARRCQILETIAQACGVDDSHSKLMEHGCDRVWKPSAGGKQKKAKTAKAFKRG